MGYVFHKKQNVTLKFSRNGRTTTKHKSINDLTSPQCLFYFNIMSSYISKNDIYWIIFDDHWSAKKLSPKTCFLPYRVTPYGESSLRGFITLQSCSMWGSRLRGFMLTGDSPEILSSTLLEEVQLFLHQNILFAQGYTLYTIYFEIKMCWRKVNWTAFLLQLRFVDWITSNFVMNGKI